MSKALYREGGLKDIGDAIRAQLGVTTKYLPGQMAAAVRSISGGNASQSYTPHEPGEEVLVEEAHMSAIGAAIRDKLGVSTRYLPGQMAAAIRSIAPIPVIRTLVSIAITTLPQTVYDAGDALDLTGIVVTATYDDSSTADVTAGCTFTPPSGDIFVEPGTYTVTASYTEGGVTRTASFGITVMPSGGTKLYFTLTSNLTQTLYFTQSAANGVTIDWGDGSTPETVADLSAHAQHSYGAAGDYVVKMTAGEGVTWSPGAKISGNDYSLVGTYGSSKSGTAPQLTGLDFDDNVSAVEDYGFYGCTSLQSVVIVGSITRVGNYAFSGCTGLKSIVLENAGTALSIGLSAFASLANLESITWSNRPTVLAGSAFSGCTTLAFSYLPYSVETQGMYAFQSCKALVNLEVAAKSLVRKTFYNCTNLQKVWLRSSVESLPVTLESSSVGKSGAFYHSISGCVLYCEPASRPQGWEEGFNLYSGTVDNVTLTTVWSQTTRPW